MFNNWELALCSFAHLWVGFSRTLSNAFSASVSSPEPWGESQQAPGPPHLDALRCSLGGSVYLVSVEIVSQATDTNTASGQLVVVAFHSSSRTHQLSDLAYCPHSVRAAVRLYPHESLQDVCYFLSSSFYKLWILWDLCKHQKVALIEVNDSLLLTKK